MSSDLFRYFFQTPIQEINDSLEYWIESTEVGFLKDVVIGPVQINELDYPCAHVIPDRSDYVGDSEHEISVTINYYFERDKRSYSFIDNLDNVERTLDKLFFDIDSNTSVFNYELDGIDFYMGELGQIMLNIISVDIILSKGFNWAGGGTTPIPV